MSKGERRTRGEVLRLRVKEEERETIEEAADKAGETFSNWARRVLLSAARRELRK